MQEYDPLIEILEHAAESCEQRSKAYVLRNLQAVLRADSELRKELQRRIVAVRESAVTSKSAPRSALGRQR
jgi:hypothetical protein